MTLADVVRRQIARYGRPLLLRRVGPPEVSVTLLGKVYSYSPAELIGGLQQGDRKIVLAPSDLQAAGFPGAPAKGDRVVMDGKTMVVQGCEPRHAGPEIARYDIWVRGIV